MEATAGRTSAWSNENRHRSAAAREIGGLDVVAALRHARRAARLSQRDLARRAGVSQSLIARIEARRVDPPIGQVQRLLGLCGMRWDVRLTAAGATPAVAAARSRTVRRQARHRARAAGDRRAVENAAARETARSLPGRDVTGLEKRRACRAARFAARAAQAEAFAAIVEAHDQQARGWIDTDAVSELNLCSQIIRLHNLPVAIRLIAGLSDLQASDVHRVLEALSCYSVSPPVALIGSVAHAAWTPTFRLRDRPVIDLAPLRRASEAIAFISGLGAVPGAVTAGGRSRQFHLEHVCLRLHSAPPQSTSLLRWHPAWPARALPVARPESRSDTACDRHTIRAVLTKAGRDRSGRRRAPYHETEDGSVRPWWALAPP